MIINDGSRIVKIHDDLLFRIRAYCQIHDDMPEAGGILTGHENISNDNVVICSMTEPMSGDKRARYRYIRRDKNHLEIFCKQYNESDGTLRYVGEWHTHPEKKPQYSSVDLANWNKICRESKNKQFFYHIIAGTEWVVIWKIDDMPQSPVKIYELCWACFD